MVRAILNGRKTQTRRVVKPQPESGLSWRGVISCSTVRADEGKHLFTDRYPRARQAQRIRCPYGQPGDRLWVKESHYMPLLAHDGGAGAVEYRADYCDDLAKGMGWHPSIHMPRRASRITLEVVSVRVERLNEISEEDAIAEGIARFDGAWASYDKIMWRYTAPENSFRSLWQSINGPGSWGDQWVWVVEFRRA